MAEIETILIVGASLAGGRAAEALRRAKFGGRVVLIGEEAERPYSRPPLSKEFLHGERTEDEVFLRPHDYYEGQRIELRLGARATRLDAAKQVVELDSGERLGFDRLLIATGVTLRRLHVPGAGLAGIHYLRTLRDAARLQAELLPGRRVVIVGAGFIGAEIASVCRRSGLEVTVLETLPVPFERVLGVEVGQILAGFHRAEGVDLRTGVAAEAFRGQGRVSAVVATSGEVFPCDFAVVGVGVVPNTAWLAGSGVEVDNGVLVDEYCETNLAGVFAAGDVANWWHPTLEERLRVEHETNAQNQAVTAARNMLGQRTAYSVLPFFWSDQYDLEIRHVGHASPWDTIAVRGSPESRSFMAFYLHRERVRAVLAVNRSDEIPAARQLIQQAAGIAPEQLRDDRMALQSLLPPRA